jgi:methylenetetrahydrofolate reductase (NADPH)
VRNVLCLTGDHMVHGDHPDAKPVYDIDSMQLVRLARRLTDEGRYLSGREIKPRPDLFVGAVENPFAPPYDFRPTRLLKKMEAGAQFIQTQIIFNVDRFAAFMTRVRDLGIDRRLPILAGVAPIRSARAARHMRDNVPGMEVPEELVRRMDQAGEDRARREEEGIRICVEIIERLRAIPGIAGFHVMPIHWEDAVGEIVRRAGLAPPARVTAAGEGGRVAPAPDREAAPPAVEPGTLASAAAAASHVSKEHRP